MTALTPQAGRAASDIDKYLDNTSAHMAMNGCTDVEGEVKMTGSSKRAVLYARVSSEGQANSDSVSFGAHWAAMLRLSERNQW